MYTIKRAAERLGIAPATLRAWERRYGIVAPARSEGRYRLYGEDDLAALRAMASLVDQGMPPSQAAEQVRERLSKGEPLPLEGDGVEGADSGAADADPPERTAGPARKGAGTTGAGDAAYGSDPFAAGLPGAGRLHPRPALILQEPGALLTAAGTLDSHWLEETLDAAFAGASFERVVDQWLVPGLQLVGDAWADRRLDVAEEHFVSAGVMRRLSAAFDAAGQARHGTHVVIGLVPGASHEIPTLAFATMLRRSGLRVTYLGADVPVQSWVEAVRRVRPHAVVLGAPMPGDAEAADRIVATLDAAEPDVPVYVGGHGAQSSARALPAATLSESAAWLVEQLAGQTPAPA